MRNSSKIIAAAGLAAAVAASITTPAVAGPHGSAADDHYQVRAGRTLTITGQRAAAGDRAGDHVGDHGGVHGGVHGHAATVVATSQPQHGTVSVAPDGSVRYTPESGFTGQDRFSYTVSDAVALYRTDLPPLATVDGVKIGSSAYGSSIAPVPGRPGWFYGLTDRGPNVDGTADGVKIEPVPSFQPAIGLFSFHNGQARLIRRIGLKAADGSPYNGQVNPEATTGETIEDLNGTELPPSRNGYDPEGLVALRDGTFWVSDEYGPYITHFAADGRQLERLSPFDGSLPGELRYREVNKGMEGLTITPDGRTLVGTMQSALHQDDLDAKVKNVAPVRIVTYDLITKKTHEYLYLLDDPDDNGTAVSEITALDDHTFLVDERDGDLEPNAYKKIFRIDLAGATDVGPAARLAGARYDAAAGGLLVDGGRTIEGYLDDDPTAEAADDLAGVGITPVSKRLDLNLGQLVSTLDPTGSFFGHDKVEGISSIDGGRRLVISNDSDFGLTGLANEEPPYQLAPKILPNGQQDSGEYLVVDTTRVSPDGSRVPTRTTTVTVTVRR